MVKTILIMIRWLAFAQITNKKPNVQDRADSHALFVELQSNRQTTLLIWFVCLILTYTLPLKIWGQ